MLHLDTSVLTVEYPESGQQCQHQRQVKGSKQEAKGSKQEANRKQTGSKQEANRKQKEANRKQKLASAKQCCANLSNCSHQEPELPLNFTSVILGLIRAKTDYEFEY